MGNLQKLKDYIYNSNNDFCFIERERTLNELEKTFSGYNKPDRYARIFSMLLSRVSTPIFNDDFFAGRVVEGLPDSDMVAPNDKTLCALGHMSLDYEKLLKVGLKGILQEIKDTATKKGDEESLIFYKNAEIVVNAIRDYANRYALEALKFGKKECYSALKVVPYEPCYDFYSALQSIWIIHMIASCYVGARDYAFGRFDKYLLPYYEKAIKSGISKGDITTLLAGFLVKTNEICGTATHNYNTKPVLCQATKQYINIGGETPSEFSSVVLESAKLVNLAQPQIVVLLKPGANLEFTNNVFDALSVLTDKMNIFNYDLVLNRLIDLGIEKSVAKEFSYSACCTLDLNYHTFRREYYVPFPHIFLKALNSKKHTSLQSLLDTFKGLILDNVQKYVVAEQDRYSEDYQRKVFVLDSLFKTDTATNCRYACDGSSKYNFLNLFCPGVATVGDSLMVVDKLVFKEHRYDYNEFTKIVSNNFSDNEDLLSEILSYTKFGNDSDADNYTAIAGNIYLDALDNLSLKDNFFAIGGFYSLERENSSWGILGATPDGRKDGVPFSENQSPTYGTDKNGITALLKSIAKLPFDRAVTGGLNLTFSQSAKPEILKALVLSYFELNGYHVGISVIDKNALLDAMENPEKYKNLTVRLYGFSEYFVSLPKWQQVAILNRTKY